MYNHAFIATNLLCFLCFSITGQQTKFITDNGFSGTFVLEGDGVKAGSITIEKLKTSIGEFSKDELRDFGQVFPITCEDCSFTIKNLGDFAMVTETKGKGFSEILTAARTYSIQEVDAALFKKTVLEIKKVTTLYEQRKLGYTAYNQFTNKQNADKLLAKIESGDFLASNSSEKATSNTPSVVGIQQIDTIKQKSVAVAKTAEIQEKVGEKVSPTPAANNRSAAANEKLQVDKKVPTTKKPSKSETADTQETNEQPTANNNYKNEKCKRSIGELETRLKTAEQQQDYLIVNEVNHALKKYYKKCKT